MSQSGDTLEEGRDPKSGRFKPGFSGNPKGMTRGYRREATMVIERVITDPSSLCIVVDKLMELVQSGDLGAIKLIIERVLPPVKSRPVSVSMPHLKTAADGARAILAVLREQADGDLLPDEATHIIANIRSWIEASAVTDLAKRIEALEAAK